MPDVFPSIFPILSSRAAKRCSIVSGPVVSEADGDNGWAEAEREVFILEAEAVLGAEAVEVAAFAVPVLPNPAGVGGGGGGGAITDSDKMIRTSTIMIRVSKDRDCVIRCSIRPFYPFFRLSVLPAQL